jgi:hypothetical protein
MPDPDQLARNRERLAKLEARWSPSIFDLTQDDAMRWYRTGMEIRVLRQRIETAEKEEGQRVIEVSDRFVLEREPSLIRGSDG